MDANGFYTLTLKELHSHLIKVLDQSKVPCESTLSKTLKEFFHLSFGSLMQASLKYNDPTFNEKRLWISRLLAQLLIDDVLIISIDESNFRSDSMPRKQWQFKPTYDFNIMTNPRKVDRQQAVDAQAVFSLEEKKDEVIDGSVHS